MKSFVASAACVALLGIGAATAARAESFASSASSAGSASLGSVSDSITDSSKSSSRDTKTADGDYRVIEVADAAERPGMLRLTLRADAARDDDEAGAGFTLTLPRAALGERGIAVGDVISARNRPYGVEFARAAAAPGAEGVPRRESFFLVLRDDWHRELDPRAVTL